LAGSTAIENPELRRLWCAVRAVVRDRIRRVIDFAEAAASPEKTVPPWALTPDAHPRHSPRAGDQDHGCPVEGFRTSPTSLPSLPQRQQQGPRDDRVALVRREDAPDGQDTDTVGRVPAD